MSGKKPGKHKKKNQENKYSKSEKPANKKAGAGITRRPGGLATRVETAAPVIMVAVISVLLFVGPFQRGLFFPQELLTAQIAVFGLLVIWGVFRLAVNKGRLIETPLDICLLLLLLAYLVSFFVAVHKRDALEELLKIASYLVVYLATIEICRYWRFPFKKSSTGDYKPDDAGQDQVSTESSSSVPPGVSLLLHLALGAAVVVTIASLGVAAGYWEFPGAYASARIASPMGYANTAAAYLMAAYLLALGLAPLTNSWYKIFYLVPSTLMLITIILTFSRGAWLLLPPLALLLILAAAPGERLRSFLYLAITGVTAVPAAFLADPSFRAGEPLEAWLVITASVVAAIVLGLGAELYLSRTFRVRLAVAGTAALVAVIAVVVLIILPATGPVQLESAADEEKSTRRVEQLVGDVQPGNEYSLSMEVNAEQKEVSESPGYAWGVRIFEGVEGYKNIELIDYRGSETDGWEQKEFTFVPSEEALRLGIQIYNRYPGTSISAREVTLSGAESDHNLNFTANRILPDRFYDRLYSFSLDRNLDRRFDYYHDAVKIIRDYPVFGTGGGGWNALYRSYQDIQYSSSEVHNHYLQVWIEAGLLGFIAFVGIWVSFAAAFIKNCVKAKVSKPYWQYWTASFLPVAALGTHSIIDWNFSMTAVGIFLFVLLGVGRSLDQGNWFKNFEKKVPSSGKKSIIPGLLGVIGGLLLMAYSIMLLSGLNATWRSQELMERNNYKQAITEMEMAMRADPLSAVNYHNLNILLEDQARRTESPENIERMLSLAEQAYELEPYNPRYVNRYGNLLLQFVDVEKGLEYQDRLIELRPRQESSYLQPAVSRLQIAEFLLQEGDQAQAHQYLNEILNLEELMEKNLGYSKPLAFLLGRAHYLMEEYDRARYYYEKVDEDDAYYEQARSELAEMEKE